MAFNTMRKIEVFRKTGGEKRDGSGKFNDSVLLVEVVEAEATERFDRKLFVSLGWFDELPDGKLFPSTGAGGKPKKLIDAVHLPGILSALAKAQQVIDDACEEPEDQDFGGDGDNIPF